VVVSANLCFHGLVLVPAFAPLHAYWDEVHYAETEHLLRLSHFLAVASITANYVPFDSAFLRRRWARPLILCGQHSLETFCCGAILAAILSIPFTVFSLSLPMQVLANVLGWTLMSGLAMCCATVGRRAARTPTPIEPQPLPLQARVASPQRPLASPVNAGGTDI